ncbi:MAG: cell division protein FtsQ/DivIB [Alphaproteobacteria bacterium]
MRWINLKRSKPAKGKRAKATRRRPMPRWTRRSLRAMGVAAIFALALGGPAWLWQSGWVGNAMQSVWQSAAVSMGEAGLRVDQILLQGRHHESADRITRVLDIKRGDPLLSVDLEHARERLETLPWIRAASIERRFPDTIRVNILERRPMALWQRENKLVLVDDEGTVITSRNLDRFRDLLVVVGKDAPAHATSLMTILADEPGLKQRVNAAVRVGDRRWNIRMDNGVYVRLPEKDPQAAWRRFARLEREHKLLKQDLLSIDLRIPDQLIVRTRGGRPGPDRKVSHRKGKNT